MSLKQDINVSLKQDINVAARRIQKYSVNLVAIYICQQTSSMLHKKQTDLQ
jgi:hypothetical protein